MTTPNSTEKVMSRIMRLLSLANDPSASEHERELAAERAEAMMAQHMIDRMDLKPEEKSKIIESQWELRFGDAGNAFRYEVASMVEDVLRQSGCRVHPNMAFKKVDGQTDWDTKIIKMVGFPEDIRYAEQVWFRVFKEFVTGLNPQWDESKSLGENCFQFLRAGVPWRTIWKIAYFHQPSAGYVIPSKTKPLVLADPATTKYNSSLKQVVKEYMAQNDLGEYKAHTNRHETYRSSFARSYRSTIRMRLNEIREKAKEAVSDSDKFALAVRSTKEQVDEEFYRLYPEFDPEVRRRMQEAAEAEAAAAFAALPVEEQERITKAREEQQRKDEEAWRRASRRARRSYSSLRDYDKTDMVAWERGKAAANKVNLKIDEEVSKPSTKELS